MSFKLADTMNLPKRSITRRCIFPMLVCLSACLVGDARSEEKDLPSKKPHYAALHWTAIRTHTLWAGKRVAIEGFLELTGTGEYPRSTLWETAEAMKHQKMFHNIIVDSESVAPLISKRFGAGADQWRVLHGLFVRIEGTFEIEPVGSQHATLGLMSDIRRIDVMNNGFVLMSLE